MLCDLATFADLSSLLPKPEVFDKLGTFSPAPLKTHFFCFAKTTNSLTVSWPC